MSQWLSDLEQLLRDDATGWVRALIIAIVGLACARIASMALRRMLAQRMNATHSALLRRGVSYSIGIVAILWALREAGFDISVLLGAAGILTVALGFASQTAASNLISGLFLIGERPFSIGDIVSVSGTTGEVISIDLISVKLRTFDNLFVRISNEAMLKAQITTLTHFPIRRLDVQIGVAYKEDIGRVRDILIDVADANSICLDEPRPLIIFMGFGESSLNLQFSVWAARENFLNLRNAIHEEVKEAFDAHDVEIPFPHRTLYTGSVTEPFPVRMVSGDPE